MTKDFKSTSVRAVIRDGDRILVEYCAPLGIYFLPGGRVEIGENLAAALGRELGEEVSGLTLRLRRYLGSIGHIWSSNKGEDSCLNHFFEVDTITNEGATAKEKGRELGWISLGQPEAECLKPPSLLKLLREKDYKKEWSYVDDERES